MVKSIRLSSYLTAGTKITASLKRITAKRTGIEYKALVADVKVTQGLSPALIVGDEWGSFTEASPPFVESILASQGAYENPLSVIISTQAASDAHFLSLAIDDAIACPSPDVCCHVYVADLDLEIDDPTAWLQANPSIGEFRSISDMVLRAAQAKRQPAKLAQFRNWSLNQRISIVGRWIGPELWKMGNGKPDMALFSDNNRIVVMGIDLSLRNDLTSACCCVMDDNKNQHFLSYSFIPTFGLEQKELRDKAPYQLWIQQGLLHAVPGRVIDYSWVFEFLKLECERLGIFVSVVSFDKWNFPAARAAADEVGFYAGDWQEFLPNYANFSPVLQNLELSLEQGRIRHGAHPLLNMAAANAVAKRWPSGAILLDKAHSVSRIDPLIAMAMASNMKFFIDSGFDADNFVIGVI